MKTGHRKVTRSVLVLLTLCLLGLIVPPLVSTSHQSPDKSETDANIARVQVPGRDSEVTPRVRKLTDSQAIAAAVNRLDVRPDGSIELDHPLYKVRYAEDGINFIPAGTETGWRWALRDEESAVPITDGQVDVAFRRERFVEQYLSGAECIEQRFVLARPPGLAEGEDFVVRGAIDCPWPMKEYEPGWLWRDPATNRVVSLGRVTVFDANGEVLPATMHVDSTSSEILVDGPALLAAAYPVTVDPEVGVDDFPISQGSYSDDFDGEEVEKGNPAVARRAVDNSLIVMWVAPVAGGRQVVGRRIDGDSGAPLGSSFQITNGPNAITVVASYDTVSDRFLVVWTTSGQVSGQLLDGDGSALGSPGVINESTINGEMISASAPAVVFNATAGTSGLFGVSWTATFANATTSTRISRVTPGGAPVGPSLDGSKGLKSVGQSSITADLNAGSFLVAYAGSDSPLSDFRRPFIQQVGADGDLVSVSPKAIDQTVVNSRSPSVIWLPSTGQYAITWEGNFAAQLLPTPTDWSLAAQLLDSTGTPIHATDRRLFAAGTPAIRAKARPLGIAWDPTGNRIMVIFEGFAGAAIEQFAVTVDSQTGLPVSTPSRLTYSGVDGEPGYFAVSSSVVSTSPGFLFAAWRGQDLQQDDSLLAPEITEIRGHLFATMGMGTLSPASPKIQISDQPFDYVPTKFESTADVAYSPNEDYYMVVWQRSTGLNNRIHLQRLNSDGHQIGDNDEMVDGVAGNFVEPKVVWCSGSGTFAIAYTGTFQP